MKTFLKAVLPAVALLMITNSASAQGSSYDSFYPPYAPTEGEVWTYNSGQMSVYLNTSYYPFTIVGDPYTYTYYSYYNVNIQGGPYDGYWQGTFDNGVFKIKRPGSTYPIRFELTLRPSESYCIIDINGPHSGPDKTINSRIIVNWKHYSDM